MSPKLKPPVPFLAEELQGWEEHSVPNKHSTVDMGPYLLLRFVFSRLPFNCILSCENVTSPTKCGLFFSVDRTHMHLQKKKYAR